MNKEANKALARSRAISHHINRNVDKIPQPKLEKLLEEKAECDKTWKKELKAGES
jgi:hypothetical protein